MAGYRGLTRDAYALDLRQFVAWCDSEGLRLFNDTAVTSRLSPANSKSEAAPERQSPAGCAPSPGFYRYAHEEGLLAQSPAVHVRRPRLDYKSHATGLDRNEVGALLVAAGLAGVVEHALVSLLAIDGLRVS